MQQKTVIFDLDGTIVNTGTPIANAINHVRDAFGMPPMEKSHILSKLNCPDTYSPSYFYGVETYTPQHIEIFENYYDKHCIIDIELYDGFEAMLTEIAKSFNLAVATNASVGFAKKILENRQVDNFFGYVIGSDCVKKPKPHPEMLFKVIDHFGTDGVNCLFVGDSVKDELAARSAGMEYVMVDWGFSDHKGAITDTEELRKALFKLLG